MSVKKKKELTQLNFETTIEKNFRLKWGDKLKII